MNKFKFSGLLGLFILPLSLWAQKDGTFIFSDTKVINAYSTTTLDKNLLDVRIGHRFGDIAGDAGGWQTLYGLENASDITIGADYGLTDDLMIGFHRTKGSNELRQLLNLHAKWRFTKSTSDRPAALALVGNATLTTMEKGIDETQINFFPEFNHRLIYYAGLVLDKRFSPGVTISTNVAFVHRNYVRLNDPSDIFFWGLAFKGRISPTFSMLLETSIPLSNINTISGAEYYAPLAAGFEWQTGGGHTFQVNLSNTRGLAPTDYLIYSTSDIGEGQFRLGFTISRLFRL